MLLFFNWDKSMASANLLFIVKLTKQLSRVSQRVIKYTVDQNGCDISTFFAGGD